MPTGYTENVRSGKINTLKDFAVLCSRNFSPVYMIMKDAPLGTPLPKEIKVSAYHLKKLEKSNHAYNNFISLSDAEKRKLYKDTLDKRREEFIDHLHETLLANERYTNMLKKVKSWRPPTKDHIGLKEFMINQLTISLESTEYEEKALNEKEPTYEEWIAEKERSLFWDIDYHTKEWQRDLEHANSTTEWIKALMDSLDE